MKEFFLVFTLLGIVIGASLVLPAIVLLLVPGRKGKMRTVREFLIPDHTVEQARQLLARRLEYEGFIVDASSAPATIIARRPARHHGQGETTVVTHATKALAAEIELRPTGAADGAGTAVRAALWMPDFVLYDTGEGRQIDLMLDRLLTAELDRQPPPVTPSPSFSAVAGLAGALTTLALAAGPILWNWPDRQRPYSIAFGLAAGAFYNLTLARDALGSIRRYPDEVTGKPLALVVVALCVLGFAAAAAWAVLGLGLLAAWNT